MPALALQSRMICGKRIAASFGVCEDYRTGKIELDLPIFRTLVFVEGEGVKEIDPML